MAKGTCWLSKQNGIVGCQYKRGMLNNKANRIFFFTMLDCQDIYCYSLIFAIISYKHDWNNMHTYCMKMCLYCVPDVTVWKCLCIIYQMWLWKHVCIVYQMWLYENMFVLSTRCVCMKMCLHCLPDVTVWKHVCIVYQMWLYEKCVCIVYQMWLYEKVFVLSTRCDCMKTCLYCLPDVTVWKCVCIVYQMWLYEIVFVLSSRYESHSNCVLLSYYL